jgi:hypothetical protein
VGLLLCRETESKTMPSESKFTYPAVPAVLPVVPRADREANHRRIAPMIGRALRGIDGHNPRILSNVDVVGDFVWLEDAFERLLGLKPEGLDRLDLPRNAGESGLALLMRRLALRGVCPWILFDPLPDEKPVEVPKWNADGSELRNPFLSELDDDHEARADRIFLKHSQPELAAYLEKQANGGPTFREHFAGIEDLRLAKLARAYDGPNPHYPMQPGDWGGSDVNRHGALRTLADSNRILFDQLKREAELGPWNPFRSPGNTTLQMETYGADPALAYVLDAAGRYCDMQTRAEIEEAEVELAARRAEIDQRRAASRTK